MSALARRLAALEARVIRQEAERLARQHGLPVAELLALAEEIAADRERFRRQHGRDRTRAEQVAAMAAKLGISEAEMLAEIEQIEANS